MPCCPLAVVTAKRQAATLRLLHEKHIDHCKYNGYLKIKLDESFEFLNLFVATIVLKKTSPSTELPVSVCYYLTTGMSINNEAGGVYVGVTAGFYHQAELSDLC